MSNDLTAIGLAGKCFGLNYIIRRLAKSVKCYILPNTPAEQLSKMHSFSFPVSPKVNQLFLKFTLISVENPVSWNCINRC